MSAIMALIARHFPGIRSSIAKKRDVQTAGYCEFDNVYFPFDENHMNKKRFVAMACGAIEYDEVKIAAKVIQKDDIVIEFGAGLGIAASRVNKICSPKKHICFEANPALEPYAIRLFKENNLNIEFENVGLGDGEILEFFAMKDYILSSFNKPGNNGDFEKILVPTVSLDEILTVHKPTSIFCDIEGAELSYFRSETFGTVTKIIIELHPNIYGDDGLRKFHANMKQHNFALKYKQKDTYCYIR